MCDDDEIGEGSEQSSNKDQDGDVSLQEEVDEEIDKNNTDEKEWFEYIINRSTKEAEEHMKKTKIPCWTETHRRMKWRMQGELHHFRKKDGQDKYSTGTLA